MIFACDTDDAEKSTSASHSKPYDPEDKWFQLGASYYDSYKDKIELSEKSLRVVPRSCGA